LNQVVEATQALGIGTVLNFDQRADFAKEIISKNMQKCLPCGE
jgi:hypothetical protein